MFMSWRNDFKHQVKNIFSQYRRQIKYLDIWFDLLIFLVNSDWIREPSETFVVGEKKHKSQMPFSHNNENLCLSAFWPPFRQVFQLRTDEYHPRNQWRFVFGAHSNVIPSAISVTIIVDHSKYCKYSSVWIDQPVELIV